MIRTAIIGTGGIAKVHVEAIKHEAERAELVAAVDIREGAVADFAELYAIPAAYTSLGTMLEREQPELVHICTPPYLHAEQSVQCLRSGAWVLCEKPLTVSLRELGAIAVAEAETGNFCSSVYQWRFGAGAKHLKGLVEAGDLGRALVGVCQTTWYRDHAYYAVPWRGGWETEGGGCTMGHGIHAMDLLLWMFGPWREVSAMLGTLDHQIDVEDVSLATVRFESGALGSVVNSVVSPRQESYLRLDFQKATVELEHLYSYRNEHWTFNVPGGVEGEELQELQRWRTISPDAPTLHHAQTSHVLDCLERGERPLTSGVGAGETLEFIASLYKSALTGERVTRGSIRPSDPFYDAMNGGVVNG